MTPSYTGSMLAPAWFADLADLVDLLDTEYFEAGFRLGLASLAVGLVLSLVVRRSILPLPVAGLLIAGATVWGLDLADVPLDATLGALGAILLGAAVGRLPRVPRWVPPLAVVPGAVWFAAQAPVTELQWVRILMTVTIVVGGLAISDFERRHGDMGLGLVFFTLAVLGMFVSVPDTETALVVGAVTVPIALLAWPSVRLSLGPEGAYLAVAMFVWVTAQGGGGRPPSIIGSVACLGVLLIEPIFARFIPSVPSLTRWMTGSAAGAVVSSIPQFVMVVICARIAARFTEEAPAILVVVGGYAAMTAWILRSRRHENREVA